MKVGRPLLLPTPSEPSSSSTSPPRALGIEVTLYQSAGSKVLDPPPCGGIIDAFTPHESFHGIQISRTGTGGYPSNSLQLRVQHNSFTADHCSTLGYSHSYRDEEQWRNENMQRVQCLMQEVLRDKPSDPFRFMLERLRKLQSSSPKTKGFNSFHAASQPEESCSNSCPRQRRLSDAPETEVPPAEGFLATENSGDEDFLETQDIMKGTAEEIIAAAAAEACDGSASILRALQPIGGIHLPTWTPSKSGAEGNQPRAPNQPRAGKTGRSFMPRLAQNLFGQSKAGASETAASQDTSERRIQNPPVSPTHAEARFSLSLILRGPACSAAAEQSLRTKVQKEYAKSMTSLTLRAVQERLVSEAESGMSHRCTPSRPTTASRRASRANGSAPSSSGPLPTPIVFLSSEANWSKWLS